jgi:hypothetical protein
MRDLAALGPVSIIQTAGIGASAAAEAAITVFADKCGAKSRSPATGVYAWSGWPSAA